MKLFSWIKNLFTKKKGKAADDAESDFYILLEEFEAYRNGNETLLTAIALKHKGEFFIEKQFIEMAQTEKYKVDLDFQDGGVELCLFEAEESNE